MLYAAITIYLIAIALVLIRATLGHTVKRGVFFFLAIPPAIAFWIWLIERIFG